MEALRRCTVCKKDLPLSYFNKRYEPNRLGKYRSRCRVCNKTLMSIDRVQNPSKYILYGKNARSKIDQKSKNQYSRANYKTNPKYPIYHKAAAAVLQAIKNKVLTRQPCIIFNDNCEGEIQAHHSDYNYPLKVTWLCKRHHETWHRLFIPTYQ